MIISFSNYLKIKTLHLSGSRLFVYGTGLRETQLNEHPHF